MVVEAEIGEVADGFHLEGFDFTFRVKLKGKIRVGDGGILPAGHKRIVVKMFQTALQVRGGMHAQGERVVAGSDGGLAVPRVAIGVGESSELK